MSLMRVVFVVWLALSIGGCKSEKAAEAEPDKVDYIEIPRLKLKVAAGKGASVKDSGPVAEVTSAQPDCTAGVFDTAGELGPPETFALEVFGPKMKNNKDVKVFVEQKTPDGYALQFSFTSQEKTKFASFRLRKIDGGEYMCRGTLDSEAGMKCVDAMCQSLTRSGAPVAVSASPPQPVPTARTAEAAAGNSSETLVPPPACVAIKTMLETCPGMTAEQKALFSKAIEEWRSMKPEERTSATAQLGTLCSDAIANVRTACALPAPAGAASPAVVAKLKDTVKFEHAEWVVLSAVFKGRRLASNNMFQDPLTADEGRYVLVQFKIRNLLSEKATTEPPKLKDGQGRVFEAIEKAGFYVPKNKKTVDMFESIPPTIAKEFWAPYQVADDSTDLVLLTHELDDVNDVKPVALGLK